MSKVIVSIVIYIEIHMEVYVCISIYLIEMLILQIRVLLMGKKKILYSSLLFVFLNKSDVIKNIYLIKNIDLNIYININSIHTYLSYLKTLLSQHTPFQGIHPLLYTSTKASWPTFLL